jgi:hypothetical protein
MSERDEPELPAKQKAHIRRRDRKRETRMVVDNAGVRRITPAVQERRRTKLSKPLDSRDQ